MSIFFVLAHHQDIQKKIIELFYKTLNESYPAKKANIELQKLMPAGGYCNGYWHGTNGMNWQESAEETLCQVTQ